jgi:hypothetical protein
MAMQRSRVAGMVLGAMFPALLACNSSPTEPRGEVVFRTLLQETFSGNRPDLPLAIRDWPSLLAVWSRLSPDAAPPLPNVDFDREMVIAVAGPGCCGNVEILAITREPQELLVDARFRSASSKSCLVARFSVHLVVLARDNAPARLEKPVGEPFC